MPAVPVAERIMTLAAKRVEITPEIEQAARKYGGTPMAYAANLEYARDLLDKGTDPQKVPAMIEQGI